MIEFAMIGSENRPCHSAVSIVDFYKAYDLIPINGPGAINNLVRGPANVWVVLHDSRISSGE